MSPAAIRVMNLNKSYKINERLIRRIIIYILKCLEIRPAPELEMVFLDDNAIKALNRRYKNSNRPTDVLSFRLDYSECGSRSFLGEVFVSLDTALSNSRIFKTCFPEEAVRYVVHGMLHLFGYDDERPKDRVKMSAKEDVILERLCKIENLSKVLTRQ